VLAWLVAEGFLWSNHFCFFQSHFMIYLFSTVAVSLALFSGSAFSSQPTRMTACKKEAEGTMGDERKKSISNCLSARKVSDVKKERTCRTEAQSKNASERKAFMRTCLSQ
jgi:hypothetical protein